MPHIPEVRKTRNHAKKNISNAKRMRSLFINQTKTSNYRNEIHPFNEEVISNLLTNFAVDCTLERLKLRHVIIALTIIINARY